MERPSKPKGMLVSSKTFQGAFSRPTSHTKECFLGGAPRPWSMGGGVKRCTCALVSGVWRCGLRLALPQRWNAEIIDLDTFWTLCGNSIFFWNFQTDGGNRLGHFADRISLLSKNDLARKPAISEIRGRSFLLKSDILSAKCPGRGSKSPQLFGISIKCPFFYGHFLEFFAGTGDQNCKMEKRTHSVATY